VVTLTWQRPPGTDELSYEVRVGNFPNASHVLRPPADISTGVRRVPQVGQAGWSTGWLLRNLKPGNYYWSVQSVDAAFRGSSFAAEQSFSVTNALPTIGAISNQTFAMNSVAGPFSLPLNDPDGPAEQLGLSVATSDLRLFPPGSIQVAGSGSSRSVAFTPAPNEAGAATIIFTVTDPEGGVAMSSTRVTVQSLVEVPIAIPEGRYSVLEAADADDDGDLDLLLAGTDFVGVSSGRATVRLFANDGTGAFLPMTPPDLPYAFDGVFAAWGDYDRNGTMDLFYNGVIYRNDGGFTPIHSDVAGIKNGQAAWGDFDADGDLDLAVAGQLESGTGIGRIYRNNGGDFFAPIQLSVSGASPSSLAWGDPDADGDLDLALAGSGFGRIYRNDAGMFAEASTFSGVGSGQLSWADVNADGPVDLAVTGSLTFGGANQLYLNLGDWTFSALPLHPGGSNWVATRLVDWDADGSIDLLGGVNSLVAVHLNPGDGQFFANPIASVSLRCRTLRVWDFDRDGDEDVLVSNIGTTSFAGQTRLYRNPRFNSEPTALESPTATAEGDKVLLRWPVCPPVRGTPVTYNVRIGTAPGLGDVRSAESRSDGLRLVPSSGNVGFATALRLRRMAPGTYHWAVQTVDASWRGGPWLEGGEFTIGPWPLLLLTSLEPAGPDLWRLTFNAPAGRQVIVDDSPDLNAWSQLLEIKMGITGQAQTNRSLTGTHRFIRLKLKP
ncbi:MAG TPA: FG-GAP-like repeat-containing protein, partial [Verrucomicrobiae bacterium]|nr:FG-GAP-like repeat-containing protein [Verrucomicrobiae bacterium]